MQKTNKPDHLKDLMLLIAVPIAIALFAAAAIYAPRLFADPKYDFVYTQCNDYRCEDSYSVDSSGHLIKAASDASRSSYADSASTIHYFDTKKDATRSITIEEAQQYNLDTSSKSPDGYTLSREQRQSGFLFWGDNDTGWYLKDGAKKKKIALDSNDTYYSQNIKFLGWVKK